MEEDWETGAAATEDWVEGGGCWEPAWVDWELATVVAVPVVTGMALVGVKEERLVAIFWAARRAVIAASYRAGNGQVSRLQTGGIGRIR